MDFCIDFSIDMSLCEEFLRCLYSFFNSQWKSMEILYRTPHTNARSIQKPKNSTENGKKTMKKQIYRGLYIQIQAL